MQGTHSLGLVALSILVSFLACLASLSLSDRIRASNGKIRPIWLASAATACGSGIWAMHFVAMLGYSVPAVIFRYDIALTAVSLALAVGFCGLGLYLCAKLGATATVLTFAGLLTGLGVAAMHYTGMAALDFSGWISYDPLLVLTSLAIATTAATVALWMCFNTKSIRKRLLNAAVMASAVCGMHYTGMAAASIICQTPGASLLAGSDMALGIDAGWLAYGVGILVALLLSGSVLAAAMDKRSAMAVAALESELLGNMQLLGSLLKIIPAAVIVVDDEMRIRAFNGRAETIFGAREEDVLGRDIEILFPARFHSAHRAAVERFAHGNATTVNMDERGEIFGVRVNGEEFPAAISVAKASGPRGLVYTMILKDISREKAVAAELMAARDAAEAAALEKSRFLANISHEVRTPLNGIVGLMQILEMAEVAPEDAKCLRLMRASTNQLLGLFDNVFDMARLDSGARAVRAAAFDAAQLAHETIGDHAERAKARGIELKLHIGESQALLCHADPVSARQVLSNLIGNAVKFTDYGDVSIAVSAGDGTIAFTVSDTGPGIAPEHLDRIFDRFYQVDNSSKRAHEGAGLGLAICRELTAKMAGALTVQSVVGEGSIFTLTLPAAAATAVAAA